MQKMNGPKKSASAKTGRKGIGHSGKSGNGHSDTERNADLLEISKIFHRMGKRMLQLELPKGKGQLFPIE